MMENCNERLIDSIIKNGVKLQHVSIAHSIAEMAQLGFISDSNSLRKLSIISALVDAYDNRELFSDVQKNNLKNMYDYVIQL